MEKKKKNGSSKMQTFFYYSVSEQFLLFFPKLVLSFFNRRLNSALKYLFSIPREFKRKRKYINTLYNNLSLIHLFYLFVHSYKIIHPFISLFYFKII